MKKRTTITLALVLFFGCALQAQAVGACENVQDRNNRIGQLVYVSHELAINAIQKEICFWELIKDRSAVFGYGKKPLTYVSAFFLAAACLPLKDMSLEHRFILFAYACLVHAPRGLLRLQNYFMDYEIGFLRDQIRRLIEESRRGYQL